MGCSTKIAEYIFDLIVSLDFIIPKALNPNILWFAYELSLPPIAETDVYIISLLHPSICLSNDALLWSLN